MRPTSGICVDGSSRGNPGAAGYQAVDIATGEVLFNVKIGDSTNNIAEFIGLVHALDYAIKNGYTEVYSDSQTAIAWVRNKKAKSTLKLNQKTERSLNLMARAEAHLSEIPGYLVKKWETGDWGESPADFGYK